MFVVAAVPLCLADTKIAPDILSIEQAEKNVAVYPNDVKVLIESSFTFGDLGRPDREQAVLQHALEIAPRDGQIYNVLSIRKARKGDWKAAADLLLRAIELSPTNADAPFNLAVVYANQTPPDLNASKTYYSKAIALGATPDATLEKLINWKSEK